mmetsp:Transcript_21973/g.46721  ORF Transcript_21973/g.46721 Transcript_21973/m.46721 type:complete len:199 (+) Transcript_21973:122-718(+)
MSKGKIQDRVCVPTARDDSSSKDNRLHDVLGQETPDAVVARGLASEITFKLFSSVIPISAEKVEFTEAAPPAQPLLRPPLRPWQPSPVPLSVSPSPEAPAAPGASPSAGSRRPAPAPSCKRAMMDTMEDLTGYLDCLGDDSRSVSNASPRISLEVAAATAATPGVTHMPALAKTAEEDPDGIGADIIIANDMLLGEFY